MDATACTHTHTEFAVWAEPDISAVCCHYRACESRPLVPVSCPVDYRSSVTRAHCRTPVTLKDERVLAASNKVSTEMPVRNKLRAATHPSSGRVIGGAGPLGVCGRL